MDIISGNKLIAKFMGMFVAPFNGSYNFVYANEEQSKYPATWLHRLQEMKYHTSWDWLMPVVEQINENPQEIELSIEARGAFLVFDQHVKKWLTDKYPLIECVWLAALEAIKWYNNQTK